jgi:peptide/nickel transport system substrate-binding protein
MTIDSIVDYIDEPSLQSSAFVSYDRNSGNLSRSVDREVDKLYEQIARVPNGDERKALVRALEARLLNEAYMVPLFWGRLFVVQAKEVEGYMVVPSHFIGQDLSDAWINK